MARTGISTRHHKPHIWGYLIQYTYLLMYHHALGTSAIFVKAIIADHLTTPCREEVPDRTPDLLVKP